MKMFKGHARVGVKERRKGMLSKCKMHRRDNEVYCVRCECFGCTMCMIDDHQQHPVQSISKCAETKRTALKVFVEPFQNLEPLKQKEQQLRTSKDKNDQELKSLEARIQILKNQIQQQDVEIQQVINQTEKVKTSEIVLLNSIQQMGDMEVIDKKNFEKMKTNIYNILQEVYPEGDKERLEKERLEKERLEKERIEKEYTRKILPSEWWDTSGPLGGVRKGTHKTKDIYFFVSKSDTWEKGAFYVPPDGYRWISTQEYPLRDGDNVYSYYGQGGWSGYYWGGKEKYHFLFDDSHKTNKAKHAGNADNNGSLHICTVQQFAGIVCSKI